MLYNHNMNYISGFLLLVLVNIHTGWGQDVFPLKISPNQRYLVDQNHAPYPILGRTAWCIISQTEENYQLFIQQSKSLGFNALEMAAITHWPNGQHTPLNGRLEVPFQKRLNGQDWDGSLTYSQPSVEAPDFSTPNEAYWQYLDKFLTYCERENMLVLMFPAYTGYNGEEQGWMREMVANGTEKTEAYGAWIAHRYRHNKNIVWMILGDMGVFTPAQKDAEAALIRGLKKVPGQFSVLYSAESHSGQNAAENADFGHEVSLNGVYTWHLAHPVAHQGRRAYADQPIMPSFLLEEPYDEEGPDGNNYNPNATQPVRRFIWWGWLTTLGGYMAGNGYVWPFLDTLWQDHLRTKGAQDLQRLNSFIKQWPWWSLVPSGLDGLPEFILRPTQSDTSTAFITASAAKDGSLLIAYLPPEHHRRPVTLDQRFISPKCKGFWFDPTFGTYLPIKTLRKKQTTLTVTVTPPGKNAQGEDDWVLVLADKSMISHLNKQKHVKD